MNNERFSEVWVNGSSGQSLCALTNGDKGWLMYLRWPEDPGFSSRNPAYEGPKDATITYRLDNGQEDEYPASWALPIAEVERAIDFFKKEQRPPPFVCWHNDSDDGVTL